MVLTLPARAWDYGASKYRNVKSFLEKGLDQRVRHPTP
jgi:hypothetical protein